MSNVFIYALRESGTTEVRYVGQTANPDARLLFHKSDTLQSVSDQSKKRAWITSMADKGKTLVMEIIDTCTHDIAHLREQYWIEKYEQDGHILTNGTKPFPSPPTERPSAHYDIGEIIHSPTHVTLEKRVIAPHKGNRDKRLEVRLSQTTLDQLATIVTKRNNGNAGKRYSIADWITEKAAEESQGCST